MRRFLIWLKTIFFRKKKAENMLEMPEDYQGLRIFLKQLLLELSPQNEAKARLLEKLRTKYPRFVDDQMMNIYKDELKTLISRVQRMR